MSHELRRAVSGPSARLRYLYIYSSYAVILTVFTTPILYMIWSSFRRNVDIMRATPHWTAPLTLAHFEELFGSQDLLRYLGNSLLVAGGSTLVGLCTGVPAAYCFARLHLRRLAFVTLLSRMAPGILFLLPLYIVSLKVGAQSSELINYIFLILAHTGITLPLVIWIMLPFFENIPRGLDEAAVVDGASLLTRFLKVALPLALPGVGVGLILSFIFSWNYFLFSLVLSTPKTVTLPVLAVGFISLGQSDWGGLMAAAVIIALPTVVLAFLAQRFVVRGLTAGAVK